MARQLEQVLADFDALNSTDYDFEFGNFDGKERVRQLCEELLHTPTPELAIPTLFKVFERMPDADFGALGALVHTLEELAGYESELINSVHRLPTEFTVWMINRILNGNKRKDAPEEQRLYWLNLLEEAAVHPLANEAAKAVAREYINFQATGEIN